MLARRILAAACTLMLASSQLSAQERTFKIGGVISLSNSMAILGDAMRRGVEVAIEMRGGKVLGAPIEVRWEDDEVKPQVAVQKTTKLIADGVDMLFGSVSSGSTLAMMKLVERRKVPLLVTLSASDDITGSAKNDWTFRTSNSVDMENRAMAEFARRTGLKKIYGVVADYGVGRQMWDSLKAKLEAEGASIAGVDYPALGTKDYSIIIDKAAKLDADGVVLIVVGADVVTFLKQAGQVRLKDSKQIFGTMVMDELLGEAVGDYSYGINSTLRYHYSQPGDANKKFVEAFRKKYNEWPSQFAGEAYDGMSWFLDVVDKTGVWDKEAWAKAFRTSRYEASVEGLKVMRACDNQASQVGLFGKAVKGSGDLPPVVMEITQTFTPEQLFTPCQ